MEKKTMTSEIYNLIILDESGSMCCVTNQTISGCNETINTIKAAQNKFAETQKHYVSIFAFQDGGSRPSRYLIKNVPVSEVRHITHQDYEPDGCTPLNDAVGSTLVDLKACVKMGENAIGSVTIITDGEENSSKQYSTADVARMISQLKEQGWNFNFIGANIDVKSTAASYNIDNSLEFKQDERGTREMFEFERKSRMRYYKRVEEVNACIMNEPDPFMSREEMLKNASMGYFEENDRPRISPDRIDTLAPDEVFVFGSNIHGRHSGGAANAALRKFGAVMGQGVGLQGQSYAIPTVPCSITEIQEYVDQFVDFAERHPEKKFLVTRIGCGNGGFSDMDMAPLFRKALSVENIYLPLSFVNVLNSGFGF